MFDIKMVDTKYNMHGTVRALPTAVHVSGHAVMTWPSCVLPQGSFKGQNTSVLRSPLASRKPTLHKKSVTSKVQRVSCAHNPRRLKT